MVERRTHQKVLQGTELGDGLTKLLKEDVATRGSIDKTVGWCRHAASWTETLCREKNSGPFFLRLIDATVLQFGAGSDSRKSYDNLVDLVVRGYEMIMQASAPAEGFDFVQPVPNESAPVMVRNPRDFALHAIAEVRRHLSDPLRVLQTGFYLQATDPFLWSSWERLRVTARNLRWNLSLAGLPLPVEFDFFAVPPTDTDGEWAMAYYDFLQPFLASRTSLSTWLGINAVAFGESGQLLDALSPPVRAGLQNIPNLRLGELSRYQGWVHKAMSEIDRKYCTSQNGSQEQTLQASGRELQGRIRIEGRNVTVDGRQVVVTRTDSRNALQLLWDHAGRLVEYSRFTNNSDPNKASTPLKKTMSDLRSLLKQFGLTIKNEQWAGYRLVAILPPADLSN